MKTSSFSLRVMRREIGVKFKAFERGDASSNIVDISKVKYGVPAKGKRAINGTITISEDLPDNTQISLVSEQKRGAKYLESPAVSLYNVDFCEALKNGRYIFPYLISHSNFPSECPIAKGTYEIYNAAPDPENLPKNMPVGDWRTKLAWTLDDESLAIMYFWYNVAEN